MDCPNTEYLSWLITHHSSYVECITNPSNRFFFHLMVRSVAGSVLWRRISPIRPARPRPLIHVGAFGPGFPLRSEFFDDVGMLGRQVIAFHAVGCDVV